MDDLRRFVRVGRRNPRYFTLDDGRPFIPVGVNLCFQRFLEDDGEILAAYERQFRRLAEVGGNFARIWLGAPFLRLAPDGSGGFAGKQLDNLFRLVAAARASGIRLKLTLEHFRTLDPDGEAPAFPGAADFRNPAYHRDRGGCAGTMEEFFTGTEARRFFAGKLEFLARHFADEPVVMAWELWNEVNTAGKIAWWEPWSREMLTLMRRLFPRQLALQSVGSFAGRASDADNYDALVRLPASFNQVHCYHDPGAPAEVCRGNMADLATAAIAELLRRDPGKPALLAEVGAVEANHAAPSRRYELDRDGTLLHDGLFAPFFAGSAGCGQFWHWDGHYLEKHDLWRHFRAFSRLVAGCDPSAEDYRPQAFDADGTRYHVLAGKTHSLLWIRDMRDVADGRSPDARAAKPLPHRAVPAFRGGRVEVHDLWGGGVTVMEGKGESVPQPSFRRSLGMKLVHGHSAGAGSKTCGEPASQSRRF